MRYFLSKGAKRRLVGRLAGLLGLFLGLQLILWQPDYSQAASPNPTIPPTAQQKPTPSPRPGSTPPPTALNLSPRPSSQAGPTQKPTPTPTAGPKFAPDPPVTHGPSALAVDADTGRILYARNIHQKLAMASTTKITTALSFLSLFPNDRDLEATTTVVKDDLVGEANMGLREGETIRLSTILLGLLTNSANESGMVLARYAGQRLAGPADPVDRFVAYMNTYVLSLGMYESHYMNPHGLDQAGHYTTAYDLAIAGWWAMHNPRYNRFAQYLQGRVDGHDFYNVNSFLWRYPGATGIKPGFTDDAGHCLVATARNKGHNVLVVVMNDDNMAQDTDALMDYSFTLLAGHTNQPLSSINLGSLVIPNSGLKTPGAAIAAATPKAGGVNIAKPGITGEALQAALRTQIDYTWRLAVAAFTS